MVSQDVFQGGGPVVLSQGLVVQQQAAIPRPDTSSRRPSVPWFTSHSSTTPENTVSPASAAENRTHSAGSVPWLACQGQRTQKLSLGTPAV